MQISVKTFEQLSVNELHDIYQLRAAVFVVEQTCYYQDIDGLDKHPMTQHLMFWQDQSLAAYARVLAPDTSYPEYASIGRIANAMSHRGQGLGHKLVARAIEVCQQYWPENAIKISAQAHLQGFYGAHQFTTVSEEYLEDGIPHVAMVRKPTVNNQ